MADPTDQPPAIKPPRQGPAHADTMAQRGAKVTALNPWAYGGGVGAAEVRRLLELGATAQRAIATQGNAAGLPAQLNTSKPGQPAAPNQSIEGSGVWFGPGNPIAPVAPRREVAGRAFDYQANANLLSRPRAYEAVSFDQLRGLAAPGGYDPLRLAIETRKDQIGKLGWSILPKKKPGQSFRPQADDKCRTLEAFFKRPDGIHPWQQWVTMLAEEHFVIDAVSLFKRYDADGKPYALELVDGSTILPRIDGSGRRPLPPDPAYTQVFKGVAAIHYSASELYYMPRNPRVHSLYGMSPVEQIMVTVNTGIRRALSQLSYFTEGNMPEAMIGLPETWSIDQIQQFQRYWDDLNSDVSRRRKARFVPGQFAFQPTRTDTALTDAFDEWLVRVVCYAFSLPPLPFVKMQNRATAETAYDTALEEGLAPFMVWLKSIIDWAIEDFHKASDYELVWDDVRKLDPMEQSQQDTVDVQNGFKSIDDVRAARGEDPYGLPAIRWGVGPLGFMSIPAIKEAIDQGLDRAQPPMQPGMGPEGFAEGSDPLAGAPPELMAMLQGGQKGGAPDLSDQEADDEAGDAEATAPAAPAPRPTTQAPLAPRAGQAQPMPAGAAGGYQAPQAIIAPSPRDLLAARAAQPSGMASRYIRDFRRRRRG